jgi:transposase-like protein
MALPTVEQFQSADPLSERVVERLLLGVSTRGYEASLERPVPAVRSQGASKSAASRRFIAGTRERLAAFLTRALDEVAIAALMLDGLEVAGQTVVVALGISATGEKVPLGLWLGSTENATVCTALVQDLLARGLRVEGRLLCVVDGGKGIRKALVDVFGDRALIQRCQVHKRRNIAGHLPKSRQRHVDKTLREAYGSDSADTARKRLRVLISWLERNGHDEAAGSLREGMEETLTVLKLDLTPVLRRSLATTNAIENLMGSIRTVTRNIKRWRGAEMVRRWTALGVTRAEQRFRRIKGHRDLHLLVQALKLETPAIDNHHVAA